MYHKEHQIFHQCVILKKYKYLKENRLNFFQDHEKRETDGVEMIRTRTLDSNLKCKITRYMLILKSSLYSLS